MQTHSQRHLYSPRNWKCANNSIEPSNKNNSRTYDCFFYFFASIIINRVRLTRVRQARRRIEHKGLTITWRFSQHKRMKCKKKNLRMQQFKWLIVFVRMSLNYNIVYKFLNHAIRTHDVTKRKVASQLEVIAFWSFTIGCFDHFGFTVLWKYKSLHSIDFYFTSFEVTFN